MSTVFVLGACFGIGVILIVGGPGPGPPAVGPRP